MLAAWFGAPGRRAPQNQVVPGARLGSRAPRKSGAAPVRGRLIAVPTKTGRLFRQPDLPPQGGRWPAGPDEGRWIEKQSVGSTDAPSSVWPSAIHLPPGRGKVFRGACAGTGAALWFVGRGFPDAPCTVPVRGARRLGAPSPCVGAASGRPGRTRSHLAGAGVPPGGACPAGARSISFSAEKETGLDSKEKGGRSTVGLW